MAAAAGASPSSLLFILLTLTGFVCNFQNIDGSSMDTNVILAPICPTFPTTYKEVGVGESPALGDSEPEGGASPGAAPVPVEASPPPPPLRWMLMPDGRGEAQVAIISDTAPKDMGEPPTLKDIHFLLYTRETGPIPEKRMMNETCFPKFDSFSPERPTIVLIHGFGDAPHMSYMIPTLRDAYLARGDYNVFAVDWSKHAARPWYFNALVNTQVVGGHLANLLDYLVDTAGARLDETHLIGFSLGAHVAGAAGSRMRNGRISRITGLDPARVLVENRGPDMRLDPSDAVLVDVVHSSGGYLGFREPLGHRDFFPNGGQWPQPGCEHDIIAVCSHRRAFYYYAEAVRQKGGLPAVQCPFPEGVLTRTCRGSLVVAYLGEDTCRDPTHCQTGTFYFETNKYSPFVKPE